MIKKNQKGKVRIFLVDDHPIVRQGLAQLINHEQDLMVCGEAENARAAIELLPECKPDFLIVDISLKGGMDGIELIKTIRSRDTDLPVLVLSMHDESLYAERALRAGALGYIMKQEGMEKMITAIRRVLDGRVYVSEEMDSRMLQQVVRGQPNKPASPLELLSDRELEIFGLLGQGVGSREIAESLFLSVKTVDSYRANIKEKLKIKNSIQLLQHALQWVGREKSAKSAK
jgi:DNA-binding NarL/FixJ family response regulator